jgi:hypothetical protein
VTGVDDLDRAPGEGIGDPEYQAGACSGQPLLPLPRRRTGVKIAGGTARDVVLPLVAVEAAGQPDAGSRLPEGPFNVASIWATASD